MRAARTAVLVASVLGCEAPADVVEEAIAPPAASTAAGAAPARASASASSSATAPHAPPEVEISGKVGDQTIELRSGYARLHRGALEVVLVEAPIACGAKPPKDARTLEFTVLPSSDGRFFAGSSFSVPFDVDPGVMFFTADASMLTIVDAQPTPGGSLVFSGVFVGPPQYGGPGVSLAGKGSIPICAGPGEQVVTVDKPGGDELTIVSAIASRRKNGSIDDIWLFTDLKGTCANRNKPNRYSFVDLMDVGVRKFEGVDAAGVQPIRPGYHGVAPDELKTGGSADPTGYGQITWDSFDAKPGGKLKGRLELWSFEGKRSGSAAIEATVCP